MKITFLTIAAIILMYYFSPAQDTIPPGNVSGTWTLSGSPYIIEGNIIIPKGQTLTIDPGVNIVFDGQYKLDVQGKISAVANATNMITFTCTDTVNAKWSGIRFDNTVSTNDTSVFYYCTIMHSDSGAIYSSSFSKIKISNSIISNNVSTNGAGIFLDHAGCLITDNNFSHNNTSGGIGCGGAIYINSGSNLCNISNNSFTFNSSSSSGFFPNNYGGAIYITGSTDINISNNIFNSNTASNDGGAVYINSCSNICNITDNAFTTNSSANGGGILVIGSQEINAIQNSFSQNNASNSGGGIYIKDSYVYLKKNNITSNTAATVGGGICIKNSLLSSTTNPYFDSNIISDNNVVNGSGSGIYLSNVNSRLYNNIISRNNFTNTACNGGGIYLDNSNAKIINDAILFNAASGDGGGIFFSNGSSPLIANSIFYGNTSSEIYQLFINDNNSAPTIIYCDVQNGSVGLASGVTYNQANWKNNISSDPAFVNFAINNFHLLSTSHCKNAGTPDTIGLNLPEDDLDGNIRVYGGRIDIGPYEYGAPQGIATNDFVNHISFYPNPSTNEITIKTDNNNEQSIILSLKNIQGKEVLNKKINFKDKYSFDVSGLSNGIYILTLQNEKENYMRKIVIQK
jgi:hypothetical protein